MLNKKILEELNFTFSATFKKGSSYIVEDGSFLNLSENVRLFGNNENEKIIMHPQLISLLMKEGYKREIIDDYLYSCVQISDGSNFKGDFAYVRLPETSLTPQQYNSLEDFLYKIMESNHYIDIPGIGFRLEFFSYSKNKNGYLPKDIIKLIKIRYNKLCLKKS